MQPALTVCYNSLSGDGSLGIGCNLSGVSSISRVPKTLFNNNLVGGINYLADDEYALDGNRLILTSGSQGNNGSVYKTEIESFQKIEAFGSVWEGFLQLCGPEYFIVTTKDGKTIKYGAYLIPDRNLKKAPYMWMVSKVQDKNGNYIDYQYDGNSGTVKLNKITYGNTNTSVKTELLFVSMSRVAAPRISYVGGRPIINDFVYTGIGIQNNGKIIYSYEFVHDVKAAGSKFFLTDIRKRMSDGSFFPPPTTLNWGAYNTNLTERTVSATTYEYASREKCNFFPCDINGDGKDDLISVYNIDNITYMDRLLNVDDPISGNKSFRYEEKAVVLGVSVGLSKQVIFKNDKMLLADVNSDGINEFISTFLKKVGNKINFVISAFTQNGQHSVSVSLNNCEEVPAFVCGDFNNDGADDLILIEDKQTQGKFSGSIIYFEGGDPVYYIAGLDFDLPEAPKTIYTSDFDADGLLDLFILTEKWCYFYKNNGGSSDGSTPVFVSFTRFIDDENPFHFTLRCEAVRSGDFNGDGLMDFLVNATSNGNVIWKLALSNGKFGFVSKNLSNLKMLKDNSREDCIVMDFNHDGRSDVIMVSPIYDDAGNYVNTQIDWRESAQWNEFELVKTLIVKDENFTFDGSNCVGDFDGDGWQDLFSYQSAPLDGGLKGYSYLSYCSNTNFASEKVWWIVDGMDIDTRIEYRPLSYPLYADKSSFYSKSKRTTDSYCNIQLPLICVSGYTVTAGNQLVADMSYAYKDLVYGFKRGELYGFTSVSDIDNLLKIKKETTVTWNYGYEMPERRVEEVKTTDGISLSANDSEYTITRGSNFVVMPLRTKSDDLLTGISQTVEYSYDTDGNPVSQTTKCGNLEEQRLMEYTEAGSWCKNRLSKLTVSKSNETGTNSRVTTYEYDSNGNLLKETLDPADEKKLTTVYSDFTAFGLPQKTSVTGSDGMRVSSCTYTPSGRFAASTTNELGEVTTYNQDETLLLLNSETSACGTTGYTYDNRQILTAVTAPEGIVTTYKTYRQTDETLQQAFYYKTEHTEGQSPVTVWYDRLGRELRNEVYGLNNQKVWTDTQYDDLGRVWMVSKPYFELSTPVWSQVCTYDRCGRPSTITTPLGVTSYAYNGLTSTVTTPRETVKTIRNLAGQLVSQTTNGKAVEYTYYPSGLTKTTTPQGGLPISMEYDLQGNRTKLIDPDGGTVTSNYNAFGQLLKESQKIHGLEPLLPGGGGGVIGPMEPLGATQPIAGDDFYVGTVNTIYSYKSSGLLEKMVRGNESTQYSYDSRNRLTCISKYGSSNAFLTSRSWEYDQFDRIQQTTETIGREKTLVTQRTYDSYGRPASFIYPNGVHIFNSYDSNGNLYVVSRNSGGALSLIWQAVEENALGQLTKEKKGPYTTTYAYNDNDFLTNIKLGNFVTMDYSYTNKGNLLSR